MAAILGALVHKDHYSMINPLIELLQRLSTNLWFIILKLLLVGTPDTPSLMSCTIKQFLCMNTSCFLLFYWLKKMISSILSFLLSKLVSDFCTCSVFTLWNYNMNYYTMINFWHLWGIVPEIMPKIWYNFWPKENKRKKVEASWNIQLNLTMELNWIIK